jgi:hypothetical protein
VYRTLQGTMQTYKEQGLLVCWGGFDKVRFPRRDKGFSPCACGTAVMLSKLSTDRRALAR